MALILPAHEQRYPTKLLPHRLQEYALDNQPATQNRAAAVRVTGQQVFDAVVAAQKTNGLGDIDPRYFVGTCFHEAGCSNEVDTEIATQTAVEGFVSVGAFQIGAEEATAFGYRLADMLDFEKSVDCFIKLAQRNLSYIMGYVKTYPNANTVLDYTDPSGVAWVKGALRAYLGITHNHGAGYVRATISKYGLNWPAYKTRNPTDNIVAHMYGEDCVNGGPYYPSSKPVPVPGHRVLSLTSPPMTGEDVKELQRHLAIGPDGVFGSDTKAALMKFQENHGLAPDGECGAMTWAKILVA